MRCFEIPTGVAKAFLSAGLIAVGLGMSALASAQLQPYVDIGDDLYKDCSGGTILLESYFYDPMDAEPLFIAYWETGDGEFVGSDYNALIMAPSQTTTYRLTITNLNTGLSGYDEITIFVLDSEAPSLSLAGNLVEKIFFGNAYDDPYGTATDNCADCPPTIARTGSVNQYAVGSYILSYRAADCAGNATTKTRTVQVIYDWTGLQQPFKAGEIPVFSANRTVPLRFELLGYSANMTSLAPKLYLAKVSNEVADGDVIDTSITESDFGNVFAYRNGGYEYRLPLKGLTQGTWRLRVDLGDGEERTALFGIKK